MVVGGGYGAALAGEPGAGAGEVAGGCGGRGICLDYCPGGGGARVGTTGDRGAERWLGATTAPAGGGHEGKVSGGEGEASGGCGGEGFGIEAHPGGGSPGAAGSGGRRRIAAGKKHCLFPKTGGVDLKDAAGADRSRAAVGRIWVGFDPGRPAHL